jgi:imidazole glycerol phosphate synthase subunit HisF
MDAKRIIPMLKVTQGRVADAPEGSALAWARRLELAGADGILFLEDPAGSDRAWIREVAGALFIPFAVAVAGSRAEDLAEIRAAGADLVVLPAPPADLPELAARFGRQALGLAVDLAWTPDGWRTRSGQEAMAALVELGQRGAGELLLTLDSGSQPGLDRLGEGLASLAMPVLVQTDSWDLGREALLQGADGLVYPASLGTPLDCKAFLQGVGLTLRH